MAKTLYDYYFDWLYEQVAIDCPRRRPYIKLLLYLFNRDFYWLVPMDENRYYDALELRDEFLDYYIDHHWAVITIEIEEEFKRHASVLEVLITLSRRCHDDIVGDDSYGSTGVWFWRMIGNLNLYSMDDFNFDREMVDRIIDIFLNRKYSHDGEGNIFYIRGDSRDMRSVEIWCQLCWYVNYILSG